jgi:hypothetical protein
MLQVNIPSSSSVGAAVGGTFAASYLGSGPPSGVFLLHLLGRRVM